MEAALQSSVYVSSPEFAGWLMKRGFRWRKLWKRRWVALHGAEIVYMESEPNMENSASLNITKAQITTNTMIVTDDIDGDPNGFAIHINDGNGTQANSPNWYLRAETMQEKKSWITRLKHVHAIVKWLEDFEKVRVLGVGGTGIVYELLHNSTGQRYAMKEMEIKNKTQLKMAVWEAELLKDIVENVQHENILHIHRIFQVGSKFYLVFPLCLGGELYEHIIRRGHFTERDAAFIVRDLVGGLNALHQQDVLHLDIKPENILFDSDDDRARVKITDFGLSKIVPREEQEEQLRHFSMDLMMAKLKVFMESGEMHKERLRGTVGYMSPELILTGHVSTANDVFAAGVVLYILLSGRPPFHSKSNREVLEKTAKGAFRISGGEWDEISAEAKDLVSKMLATNPLERISTEEILAHPWLQNLDEDANIAETADEAVRTPERPTSGGGRGQDGGGNDGGSSRIHMNRATVSVATTSINSRLPSKHSEVNLANALRQLSGIAKQRRSEKLASNLSRLVSSLTLQQQLVGGPGLLLDGLVGDDAADGAAVFDNNIGGTSRRDGPNSQHSKPRGRLLGLRPRSTLANQYLVSVNSSNHSNNNFSSSSSSSAAAGINALNSKHDKKYSQTSRHQSGWNDSPVRTGQPLFSSSGASMNSHATSMGSSAYHTVLSGGSDNSSRIGVATGGINAAGDRVSSGGGGVGADDDGSTMLVLNSQFRAILIGALLTLDEVENGRLSIEQFSVIILSMIGFSNPTSSSLASVLMGRFVDRDADGYITADDVFAMQAMLMQRSEVFLKQIVFRVYTEAIWYPGRQFNLMNLKQQVSKDQQSYQRQQQQHQQQQQRSSSSSYSAATSFSATSSAAGSAITAAVAAALGHSSSSSSDSNANNSSQQQSQALKGSSPSRSTEHINHDGTSVTSSNGNANRGSESTFLAGGGTPIKCTRSDPVDVVEPPKFITARHVSAVFEKLGYDPLNGQKAFDTLCNILERLSIAKREAQERAEKREEGEEEEGEEGDNDGDEEFEDRQFSHSSECGPADHAVLEKAPEATGNDSMTAETNAPSPHSLDPLSASAGVVAPAVPLVPADAKLTRNANNTRNSIHGTSVRTPQGLGENATRRRSETSKPNPTSSSTTSNSSSSSITRISNIGMATSARTAAATASRDSFFSAPLYARKPRNSFTSALSFTSSSSSSGGNSNTSSSNSSGNARRMDVTDFIRCVEIDDILVQALTRRARLKMISLMRHAETIFAQQQQQRHHQLRKQVHLAAAAAVNNSTPLSMLQTTANRHASDLSSIPPPSSPPPPTAAETGAVIVVSPTNPEETQGISMNAHEPSPNSFANKPNDSATNTQTNLNNNENHSYSMSLSSGSSSSGSGIINSGFVADCKIYTSSTEVAIELLAAEFKQAFGALRSR